MVIDRQRNRQRERSRDKGKGAQWQRRWPAENEDKFGSDQNSCGVESMEMNETTNGSNIAQETQNYFHFFATKTKIFWILFAMLLLLRHQRERKKLLKGLLRWSVFLQKSKSTWVAKTESKKS